jgi:hypothetical protein
MFEVQGKDDACALVIDDRSIGIHGSGGISADRPVPFFSGDLWASFDIISPSTNGAAETGAQGASVLVAAIGRARSYARGIVPPAHGAAPRSSNSRAPTLERRSPEGRVAAL